MLELGDATYRTEGGNTITIKRDYKGWFVDTPRRDLLKDSHGWFHFTHFDTRDEAVYAAEVFGGFLDRLSVLATEMNAIRNEATPVLNALCKLP